jgi:MFS family permease
MTTSGPDKKRHLPLLPKVEVAVEGDEDRPPWHWSAIGAIGVFVFWVPLILAINGLLPGPGAAWIALNAAAFALACFGSGFLIGRYGGKAGRREAMVGGAAAAATAWLAAATQGVRGPLTWVLLLAVLVAVGGGAARVGGALGHAGRKA